MSKKSPFIGYSSEQVMAIEATTYVLQVGSEIFNTNGKWVFTKKSAYIYYNKILRELLDQLRNGNNKQRKNAERVLQGLKVLPLRIH